MSDLELNVHIKTRRTGQRQPEGGCFRILVLGNFSGRSAADEAPATQVIGVDRDNFGEVMARMKPGVALDIEDVDGTSEPFELLFETLDHFHPDRLCRDLPVIRDLRKTRQRLEDPAVFAEVSRSMGSDTSATPAEPSGDASRDLVAEMLEEHDEKAVPDARRDIDSSIEDVARRHVEAARSPSHDAYLALIDAATTERLRGLLHLPAIQRLEATWRSLDRLVRSLDTDSNLRIAIADASKESIRREVEASKDVRSTGLYKRMVDEQAGTAGETPWTLIVGDFTIEADTADLRLLAHLARTASDSGASFVAGAAPSFVGPRCFAATPDPDDWPDPGAEFAEAWKRFRALPEAVAVGLMMPRVLVRLPYGKQSWPIRVFDFEEMDGVPEHDDYLWGTPGWACAERLGQAFEQQGWTANTALFRDLSGLPVHTYESGGGKIAKPCTEAWLTDRACQRILDVGVMAFASLKYSDRARIVEFRSVADPPTALGNRW